MVSHLLPRLMDIIAPSIRAKHANLVANSATFLGLDVSVRCTGIAVIDASGRLRHVEVVSSAPDTPALLAAASIGKALQPLCTTTTLSLSSSLSSTIYETGIEDFPMGFQQNMSNSGTRYTLARVAGIAAFIAMKYTNGRAVCFHYPVSIRGYFGLKRIQIDPIPEESAQAMMRRSKKEGKEAVLRYVLGVHGNGNINIAGAVPNQILPLQQQQLPLLLDSTSPTRYDKADAILTAMFTVANHLHWHAASDANGMNFMQVAEELLRAQQQAIISKKKSSESSSFSSISSPSSSSSSSRAAYPLPPAADGSVLATLSMLEQYHKEKLNEERRSRHEPLSKVSSNHTGQGEEKEEDTAQQLDGDDVESKSIKQKKKRSTTTTAPKKKKQAGSSSSLVEEEQQEEEEQIRPLKVKRTPAELKEHNASMEKLYTKIRAQLDAACKMVVFPALIPWPTLSNEDKDKKKQKEMKKKQLGISPNPSLTQSKRKGKILPTSVHSPKSKDEDTRPVPDELGLR